MAVAMAAVDVVDVYLTVDAEVESVAMTVVDVVTASQDQPLSYLRPAPTKTMLNFVKAGIVHRHVTGNRIFVDDNTYRNLMDATERHAVF